MPRIRETPDARRVRAFDKTSESAVGLADLAMQKARELLEAGQPREANYASATARNAAVVSGVSFDKGQVMKGLPTEIHEQRDAEQIIASLASMGVLIDGTATEVAPRELPPAARGD